MNESKDKSNDRAQAVLGEKLGGLSARRLTDQALACKLAAKLVARAKVKDAGAWLARVGLQPEGE
eukprot:1599824-Lingulodinium_polyedra.AAC.1